MRISLSVLSSIGVLLSSLATVSHADWRVGGYGRYQVAEVDGFQQTPKGGRPGTTSSERPQYDELGIHREKDIAWGLWTAYQGYSLGLDYLPLTYSGETILSTPLTTHSIALNAGSYFHAKVDDHLYSLYAGKEIAFSHAWLFTPKLLLHGLDHHYEFQSGGFSSTRAFFATGIGIGFQLNYMFRLFSIGIDLHAPIPITNLDVYKAQVDLCYLGITFNHLQIKPQATVGWQKIEFKDKQPIPNHLSTRQYPVLGVGLLIEYVS